MPTYECEIVREGLETKRTQHINMTLSEVLEELRYYAMRTDVIEITIKRLPDL